jgi:DNA-binding MarR family transcriptional regulator
MFNQCTCTRLRRLTRRITSIYDRHLLPDALTISQYSLLSRVGKHGSIANLRLAAEMGMDRSTLSRNIKPLMAAGWIATVDMPPDEHVDKRSFGLGLSDAGKAKLAKARPNWVQAQLEIDGLLGEDLHAALSGMIDETYDKLQEA